MYRAVAVFVACVALAAAVFMLFFHRGEEIRDGAQQVAEEVGDFLDGKAEYVRVPLQSVAGPPEPTRIIYLNREGALLHGGTRDRAHKNISSIVHSAGLTSHALPAFTGSHRQWEKIKACLTEQFAPYDVEIVDRRPVDTDDYLMVVMGGSAGPLKPSTHDHGVVLGLAPFSGGTVRNAIVLVFTKDLGSRLTRTCEAASMEIAHAYGLDHARSCADVMTYKKSCVKLQRFTDKDIPCGEGSDRPCKDGAPTQNSHQKLLQTLGAKQG